MAKGRCRCAAFVNFVRQRNKTIMIFECYFYLQNEQIVQYLLFLNQELLTSESSAGTLITVPVLVL